RRKTRPDAIDVRPDGLGGSGKRQMRVRSDCIAQSRQGVPLAVGLRRRRRHARASRTPAISQSATALATMRVLKPDSEADALEAVRDAARAATPLAIEGNGTKR